MCLQQRLDRTCITVCCRGFLLALIMPLAQRLKQLLHLALHSGTSLEQYMDDSHFASLASHSTSEGATNTSQTDDCNPRAGCSLTWTAAASAERPEASLLRGEASWESRSVRTKGSHLEGKEGNN